MQPPEIRGSAGSYVLRFPDLNIVATVDRVAETGRHEVTAETTLQRDTPDGPEHIHTARLNLVSTRSRTEIRRTLEGMYPEEIYPWDQIVEILCVEVLERWRGGEPIVKLADMAMPDGLTYRVWPMIQEKQATLLFGEGDSGKSWFAMLVGTLVASGIPYAGMDPTQGRVLYLDYETDADTTWERLNMLTKGIDQPIPEHFYYRRMTQLVAMDADELNRLVEDYDIDLVIVDSAAPAVGEPESAQATNEYFRALRGLDVTSLTIAHVSKSGRENEAFGSIFWRNLPRSNFRVNADHQSGAQSLVMALKHTKSNNGRRLSDQTLRLDFLDQMVRFRKATLDEAGELERTLPMADRIADALSRGSLSVTELARDLNTPADTIGKTLRRLKDDRFVVVQTDASGRAVAWGLLKSEAW